MIENDKLIKLNGRLDLKYPKAMVDIFLFPALVDDMNILIPATYSSQLINGMRTYIFIATSK